MKRYFQLIPVIVMFISQTLLGQGGILGNAKVRTKERVLPSLVPYLVQVPGTGLEEPIDPAEYWVGPGDVFLVSIIGVDPYLLDCTISPSQKLIIPDVGTILVEGMTAEQVSNAVLDKISVTFPTSEADCFLYGIREIRIGLVGAVSKPGIYRVTPLARISDLLTFGGSWSNNSAMHRIEIEHSGGETDVVDYTRYLRLGEIESNPKLREGDKVFIPHSDLHAEMIMVRGMAAPAQYYTINEGQNLKVFLDSWYKPDRQPAMDTVKIHRTGPDGQLSEQLIPANEFQNTIIQAGDIIYIDEIPAVTIVGEVNRPGKYEYQPGMTAYEYISKAMGINRDGSKRRIKIESIDGKSHRGGKTQIMAGDVISVGRSTRSVMVGQSGLIQVGLAVLNMILIITASR